MEALPGYTWEVCEYCNGEGVFEYDTCRPCMGEGGRWIPILSENTPLPQKGNHHDNQTSTSTGTDS